MIKTSLRKSFKRDVEILSELFIKEIIHQRITFFKHIKPAALPFVKFSFGARSAHMRSHFKNLRLRWNGAMTNGIILKFFFGRYSLGQGRRGWKYQKVIIFDCKFKLKTLKRCWCGKVASLLNQRSVGAEKIGKWFANRKKFIIFKDCRLCGTWKRHQSKASLPIIDDAFIHLCWFGVQVDGHDQAVETQNFGKNQD